MEAILRYKRLHPDGEGPHVVDVVCPACSTTRTLAFDGWSAIMCPGCDCELTRPEHYHELDICGLPRILQVESECVLEGSRALARLLEEARNRPRTDDVLEVTLTLATLTGGVTAWVDQLANIAARLERLAYDTNPKPF